MLLFSSCTTNESSPVRAPYHLDIGIYHNADETFDEEGSRQLAYSTYDEIRLSDGDKEKYPSLQKALTEFNAELSENTRKIYDRLRDTALDAQNDKEALLPLYHSEDLYVRRADGSAVSILSDVDYYLGGAHGYYYCYGTAFDTESGRILSLSDVVSNPKKLPKLIKSELYKNYRNVITADEDSLDKLLSEPDSLAWSLEPDGLIFFFDPYALASYGDGILFAKLPESVLKPEYRTNDANYIENFPYLFNLGEENYIFIDYTPESTTELSRLNIHIGDEKYSEDISAKSAFETYIRTKDGRIYIMIEFFTEDGASETRIYSIDNGVKRIKTIEDQPVDLCFDGKPVSRKCTTAFKKLINE